MNFIAFYIDKKDRKKGIRSKQIYFFLRIWLEAIIVNNTNSTSTIKSLLHCFATHWFPQVIKLDNRSLNTSHEFAFFVKTSGIKHIKSAPYHPAPSGCARGSVRTFKTTMKKLKDIESISDRLRTFLLQYCITPQSFIGKSPAQRLMNKK